MTAKVYPGSKQADYHIVLSDGVRAYGLSLADGPRAVQEIPMTPSTVHFSGGGSKFGDWEPGMSHIEQRTWEGGRGQDSFVDDSTRYFDSKNAWTLTPGKLFPAPAWKFANGFLTEINENLPGDMDWRSMYGDFTYIAQGFDHSTSWATYAKTYLWIRRVGSPGTLTIALKSSSMGAPGIQYGSDTLTAAAVNENEVYLVEFSITGSGMIGDSSFVVAIGNDTDDAANHWEIGVDIDGGTGKYWERTGWEDGAFTMYYRVTSAPATTINRKWHWFEFQGALYAVDQKPGGGASKLYINGDRGKATAGTADYIQDSNKTYVADAYIGAWVKIVKGTGVGQKRLIDDNSTVRLYVTPDWDITPDTTSEYVIYHTPIWQDISPSSGDQIDGAVKDVCVVDDYVCFAEGQSVNILKMRWNAGASPPAHEFDDDGSNKADLIFTMFDATNDVQVYAVNAAAATIARAAPTAWATGMTFGTAFDVGESDQPVISLYAHDGKLYACKPDSRYYIAPGDTATKELGELGFTKSSNNGQAVLSHGLYTYFSWGGYALQRLYDSSGTYDLTSVGPDKDQGLPSDRKGPIVALAGSPPGILAAIDGGSDNYSSILVMPVIGYGWHEVMRGYAKGKRIQNIYFQDSHRPRLWCDLGGELVYMDWPLHSFNPLKDSGMTYMPEAHLVSSTIDMGVSNLPKFIESLTATVESLTSGIEVQLDYQVNENVGTSNWINAGSFQVNPFDTVPINQGEVYRMRFRLRLYTNDEDTPPVINATVLEGFARTPVKYQWNLRIKTSSTQRDLTGKRKAANQDELLAWLKDCARSSRQITMRAIWEQMDSKVVIVEPPTLLRQFTNNVLGGWGGQMTITLREV